MATWILRMDPGPGDGPLVAVKDLIDVAGVPTTAGSAPVAATAGPATDDAACLAPLRAAGARIAGKANLHELAFGGTGVNRWSGTPVNPLDVDRVPGGSSSGSAVAVATGEVDVALGTDSAGSIRTPAACCGVVGLKTTHGRLPLGGVRPLAPSLDTVGPLAPDVAGIAAGMALLEPGFAPAASPAAVLGRVRLAGTDPVVDEAVDRVLATAGIAVIEIELPGWDDADAAARVVLFGEAWRSNGHLTEAAPDGLGADVADRLAEGRAIGEHDLDVARAHRRAWRTELAASFDRVPVLVLPALRMLAPRLDGPVPDTRYASAAINLAGHPALAMPAPTGGHHLPASLQLVGPDGSEDLLVATAATLEAAANA